MSHNQNHSVSEIALPFGGWQFVGAADCADCGQTRDEGEGFALVIAHAAYAEGSRWEQTITGLSPGLLLTLKGKAQTQGPCMKSIGEGRFMSGGARIVLEAFAVSPVSGQVSLGAVDCPFFPPWDPDGAAQAGVDMEGNLRIVLPDGTEFVRVSAELSGEGSVTFSGLTLTAEDTDAASMNDALVDGLGAAGTVHSPEVKQALRRVPRHHFLPGTNWGRVYQDDVVATHFADGTEVSISSSSQPTIMALMLEQLQVAPGMRVLEVGAGTGYNAALLAQLTGGGDHVWAVDVDEPFCAEARAHLTAAGVSGVHVVCADGWGGWPDAAPFDRLIVTFSAHDISPRWFEQLREGGRLVLPWGAPDSQQRSAAFRKEDGRLVMESLHFCGFMPMRGAHAWSSSDPDAGRQWQDWLFPGQPEGDPTALIAYPLGSAPPVRADQRLIKRTWFEYVASWD
jgi:protein-L-isoaspartate(D-aspartate) O-methyltransferase